VMGWGSRVVGDVWWVRGIELIAVHAQVQRGWVCAVE
jgi:hypothetical protein